MPIASDTLKNGRRNAGIISDQMKAKINQLELNVLYDISQIIGHALNLDQTLERILGILSKDLSMKRATVTLVSPDDERLVIAASHGLTSEEKERGVYRLDEGVTGLIFSRKEPFVVPDISADPLFLNKTGARDINKGAIAFIGAPIILHGTAIGVLSIDRLFEEEISFEEDIRFLSILSALIAQLVSLNRQVQQREFNLVKANEFLKAEISQKAANFFSTAKSNKMLEVQQLIRKVAPTKATVILLGESGTGKTLAAQIIHELSSRKRFPFVKINSAALPETLLESELFGHEKGAFTGATETKKGRVEEADGGTLFLDEIGEVSLQLQTKLLRFIQDKEFERIGSSKTRKVDVRIITATNLDLDSAVAEGLFRQDLYYRLNVFPIRMPPLSSRREDIPSMIKFFSRKQSREYVTQLRFTDNAILALSRYSWPGNIREMENLMERLAILSEGSIIDTKDLDPYISYGFNQLSTELDAVELDSLQEMEKRGVVAALERNNWVQSRAARELGITLRQMGYRIKKFGLEHLIRQKNM
ncbi:MAG: sigma 54-interacting transcriptional regulator [Syntrophaceae bacterium]|nr:sigma 54-interacting transcriptional regulator [Syntrophaceae bacterium]